MSALEKQKLDALLSNELAKIEQSIAATQASTKQMENLEAKRMLLQQQAGFADYPLRKVASMVDEPRQSELLALLAALDSDISEIKFYNAKSMELAETNLKRFSPAPQQEQVYYNKPKEQAAEPARQPLWQTKV